MYYNSTHYRCLEWKNNYKNICQELELLSLKPQHILYKYQNMSLYYVSQCWISLLTLQFHSTDYRPETTGQSRLTWLTECLCHVWPQLVSSQGKGTDYRLTTPLTTPPQGHIFLQISNILQQCQIVYNCKYYVLLADSALCPCIRSQRSPLGFWYSLISTNMIKIIWHFPKYYKLWNIPWLTYLLVTVEWAWH